MRFISPALLAGVLVAAPLALAQDYIATPVPPAPAGQFQNLPPIEQLVAPIALYPDPLIALMLPAAAHPDQIQAVAADPAGADDPSFDASVQGLAHYPNVLNWMAANPAWTQQLGGAFAGSPADVMAAIQSLRQRARAAGTLAPSNYEQIIVDQDGQIEILPAQPETIYIPTYDPSVVYWAPPPGYYGSYFGWSEPYPIGAWLTFDFDWHRHALWYGDWYGYRRTHGGWNRPIDYDHVDISVAIGRGHAWRPPAHPPTSPVGRGAGHFEHNGQIAQPRPAAGNGFHPAPEPPRGRDFREQDPRGRDPREVNRSAPAPSPETFRGRGDEPPARARPEDQPRARPVPPQPEQRTEPERGAQRRVEDGPRGQPGPNTPPPVHPIPTREQPVRPVPTRPPGPPHPVQAPRPPPPPAAPAPAPAPVPADRSGSNEHDHDR